MPFEAPSRIELLDSEKQLHSLIPATLLDVAAHTAPWTSIADAMEELFRSLGKRAAIPHLRTQIFVNRDYAEIGKKAPLQVFEENGTSGKDVCRHPSFIPFLQYFIQGPDLPPEVMAHLCGLMNKSIDKQVPSQDKAVRSYVRSIVKSRSLRPYYAGTQFFRFAIEIGLDLTEAKKLRTIARIAGKPKER